MGMQTSSWNRPAADPAEGVCPAKAWALTVWPPRGAEFASAVCPGKVNMTKPTTMAAKLTRMRDALKFR
ncbi:hypothetical protein [Streptomyces sp. NPDC008317]|uniref:hypothetical protein n=1 Tax=unclassified Streptomyces TaxID=2593676 RepID=UPI0036E169CC